MAGKRQKKEPDVIGRIPGNVDLRSLTREEVLGKDGILKRLTGRLLQKAPEAEMTERLGCGENSNAGDNSGNSRNGDVRAGDSTKHSRRAPPFNGQIIPMYPLGGRHGKSGSALTACTMLMCRRI